MFCSDKNKHKGILLTSGAHMEDSPKKNLPFPLDAPFDFHVSQLLKFVSQYTTRLWYNTDCLISAKVHTSIQIFRHFQMKQNSTRRNKATQLKWSTES